MKEKMIPEEAVEAAMKAFFSTWCASIFVSTRMYAEAMLNAAAPYMLTEAWEEGWQAGSSDETDSYWGPSAVPTPNPYKAEL